MLKSSCQGWTARCHTCDDFHVVGVTLDEAAHRQPETIVSPILSQHIVFLNESRVGATAQASGRTLAAQAKVLGRPSRHCICPAVAWPVKVCEHPQQCQLKQCLASRCRLSGTASLVLTDECHSNGPSQPTGRHLSLPQQ